MRVSRHRSVNYPPRNAPTSGHVVEKSTSQAMFNTAECTSNRRKRRKLFPIRGERPARLGPRETFANVRPLCNPRRPKPATSWMGPAMIQCLQTPIGAMHPAIMVSSKRHCVRTGCLHDSAPEVSILNACRNCRHHASRQPRSKPAARRCGQASRERATSPKSRPNTCSNGSSGPPCQDRRG